METGSQVVSPDLKLYALLQHRFGIFLPEALRGYLEDSCKRISKDLGYKDVEELLEVAKDNRLSTCGWRTLIHEVTIHESEFYRFPSIYNFCVEVMKYKGGGRIWFPACSHGQEVYSVAELIVRSKIEEVELIGTDISHFCIEQAKVGIYRDDRSGRSLTGAVELNEQSIRVPESYKRIVSFDYHNLCTGAGKTVADVDIVVCTRMLIYYPQEIRHKMLESMGRSLKLGGYICLGTLEDSNWNDRNFKMQRNSSFTIFKKVAE